MLLDLDAALGAKKNDQNRYENYGHTENPEASHHHALASCGSHRRRYIGD
jgi:hypothetical protein